MLASSTDLLTFLFLAACAQESAAAHETDDLISFNLIIPPREKKLYDSLEIWFWKATFFPPHNLSTRALLAHSLERRPLQTGSRRGHGS